MYAIQLESEDTLIMQILRMRRGRVRASKLSDFGAFIQSLSSTMQPLISPYHLLLATALDVSANDLKWGSTQARPSVLISERDPYTLAEAFLVPGG